MNHVLANSVAVSYTPCREIDVGVVLRACAPLRGSRTPPEW
jgi:hypothetical protein